MKIKICVPNNPMYAPLIENREEAEAKYDIEIFVGSEKQTREMFLAGKADIAFLSPYGYGLGNRAGNYRVVPGPALAAEAYTGLMSLNFNPGLLSFEKVCYPNDDEFAIIATKMILAERYGIDPKPVIKTGKPEELQASADAYFSYGLMNADDKSLDITDDWFDTFESPLILGFWVCRFDEHPENVIEIVQSLAAKDLLKEEPVTEIITNKDYSGRSGAILWHWETAWETPTDDMLEALFMSGYLPEIGDVKILGVDYEDV